MGMLGHSLSARPRIANRIGLSLGGRISMTLTCTFCRQPIDSDADRVKLEAQIEDLTYREEVRGGKYEVCFGCRQQVINCDSPSWRRKVDALIRYLRRMRDRKERHEAKLASTIRWPKTTESLVGKYWDGPCPLDNTEMKLNTSDYYECPKCRIQIGINGGAHVLQFKGLSKFKTRPVCVEGVIHHDPIVATDELPGIGSFPIVYDYRVK